MSDLTEDMVAAAGSVISAYTGGDPDSDKIAREALEAALAGRVVLDLPEPDRSDGHQAVWITSETNRGRDVVARRGSVQDTYRIYDKPADAVEHARRLVAAACEAARRLAAEGGDPT